MNTITIDRLREHADSEAHLLHIIAEHNLRPTHTYAVVKNADHAHNIADAFEQSVIVLKKSPIPHHTQFSKGGVGVGHHIKSRHVLIRRLKRHRTHYRQRMTDTRGDKHARYRLRYIMTGRFCKALLEYDPDIHATGEQIEQSQSTARS